MVPSPGSSPGPSSHGPGGASTPEWVGGVGVPEGPTDRSVGTPGVGDGDPEGCWRVVDRARVRSPASRAGAFSDDPAGQDYAATNLAELAAEPGGAVDVDSTVLVRTTATGQAVFERAVYAKYRD